MHDPMTVAFELRYPWRTWRHRHSKDRFLRTYHDAFITIWHVDPESDGTDDSCDWFASRLPKRYAADLKALITNPDDNLTAFFGDDLPEHEAMRRLFVIASNVRRIIHPRPWWRHPRWHVWHWQVQVHAAQKLKRRLFTRCAFCAGPFAWGESVYSAQWGNKGPQWFRSEHGVYHEGCFGMRPKTELLKVTDLAPVEER